MGKKIFDIIKGELPGCLTYLDFNVDLRDRSVVVVRKFVVNKIQWHVDKDTIISNTVDTVSTASGFNISQNYLLAGFLIGMTVIFICVANSAPASIAATAKMSPVMTKMSPVMTKMLPPLKLIPAKFAAVSAYKVKYGAAYAVIYRVKYTTPVAVFYLNQLYSYVPASVIERL
jgi:hypothetical protein